MQQLMRSGYTYDPDSVTLDTVSEYVPNFTCSTEEWKALQERRLCFHCCFGGHLIRRCVYTEKGKKNRPPCSVAKAPTKDGREDTRLNHVFCI